MVKCMLDNGSINSVLGLRRRFTEEDVAQGT